VPSSGFWPSRGPLPFSIPNLLLSLSPLGLGLSASPVDRASVAPCPIAASLMGTRLTSRPPSPLFVPGRQVGPTCHHLHPAPPELHSAPPSHRATMAATPSPAPPLFMADRYPSLISAIITIYTLYSLHPPFNYCRQPLPSSPHRRSFLLPYKLASSPP
jgi:hypothetical protein